MALYIVQYIEFIEWKWAYVAADVICEQIYNFDTIDKIRKFLGTILVYFRSW